MKVAIRLDTGETPAPPPNGICAMSWAVDFVLTLQEEGMEVTPALQQLVPLVAVALWAQQLRALPSREEISARWSISRATAYRWLPELRRARRAVGKA